MLPRFTSNIATLLTIQMIIDYQLHILDDYWLPQFYNQSAGSKSSLIN